MIGGLEAKPVDPGLVNKFERPRAQTAGLARSNE
jgi:hypothetical protein